MSARETNAFNELFAIIYDAAAVQEKSSSSNGSAISVGTNGIDDLIGRMRKYPKRPKWSTELDDILDRQKEIINLFTTDQELLEWATDAVFGESQRYEAAARKAILEAASSGTKGELPMLQPPTYPHLVALIMQTFREKFNDPHLALSMFEHARNLSIASYVFGCSSQAYHQLIETRWKCFQDLMGVLEALQEMQLNGVRVSGQTHALVERLRREIGEKHLWAEESEVGSDEVLNILTQIESLALSNRKVTRYDNSKANTSSHDVKWDDWKSSDTKDEDGDAWSFDQWSSRPKRVSARERAFDNIKGPAGRPVRSRLSGFEDRSSEHQPSVDTSSLQSRDVSWRDEWEFDEGKLIHLENRDAQEMELDGKRTSVTKRTASKQFDFMDDWSLGDEETSYGASSSKSDTYGNSDDWAFSQGELERREVEEEGRKGELSRMHSRDLKLKDDCSLEDDEFSTSWSSRNVKDPQDEDAWGFDQDTFDRPQKKGRILKRRRFGLRDVSQQPRK
ncbi:hypothetical protein J132_04334 [Termitomyces sp. J132]|nr:hypothetical protein J132_04334 [Termitomyces sp. J132]